VKKTRLALKARKKTAAEDEAFGMNTNHQEIILLSRFQR
jgi:hypothetical protein